MSNNFTIIQTLAKAMDRLEFLSNQLSVWQLAIKNLDKRTNRIENFLQLAPLETDNQSSPPTSLNNTSSSINENTAVVTNNNANSTSSSTSDVTFPSPIATASALNNQTTNTNNLPSVNDISNVVNEVSSLKNLFGDLLKQLSGSSEFNTSQTSNKF